MSTTEDPAQTKDEQPTAIAADSVRTLPDLIAETTAKHSSGNALRYPGPQDWERMSYAQLGTAVREIGRGLMALGVRAGDRVAILSNTRAEWTLADIGIMFAGAVVVPVYQTNSPEACQYVLEHSEATAIFCEDAEQTGKIDAIRAELPALRHVIRFDRAAGDALSLDGLRERAAEVGDDELDARLATINPGDLATIVYTSGTTGPPKGCMLTHANFTSDVAMVQERIGAEASDDVAYVFLPLAHVLTRIVQFFTLAGGGELAYWRRDPKRLLEDVAMIRPTHLPSAPRIFEKIYTAARAKALEAGGAKAKIFDWSVDVGR